MKTAKFLILSVAILVFMIGNSVNAQTNQFNLTATLDHAMVMCMETNETVSGHCTYHFTYHLNQKTGKIEWIHFNVIDAEMIGDESGTEYLYRDTAHDNMNYLGSWEFWNNINAWNESWNSNWVFDVEDGFLDPYLPADMPDEGTFIGSVFSVKAKSGGVVNVYGYTKVQFHLNANGVLTADVENISFDCGF